jgi:ParD-like antitoxin of type II bacterial toxin-antitoxin system
MRGMGKSIRVSDGIYELAASAGEAVNRSLAEQIEYWARLGASLDAAGITMAQALQLLGGDATLKERVIAHVGQSRSTRQRRTYTGAVSIAARNAQLEEEVSAGLRSPESLFLLSRKQLKSARFVERASVADGTGW